MIKKDISLLLIIVLCFCTFVSPAYSSTPYIDNFLLNSETINNSTNNINTYNTTDSGVENYYDVKKDIEINYSNNDMTKSVHKETITKDAEVMVEIQTSLSTKNIDKSERIIAIVNKDYTKDGKVLIPAGTLIYGKHGGSKSAKCLLRNGTLIINFYEMITPNGQRIKIETKDIVVRATKSLLVDIATVPIRIILSAFAICEMAMGPIAPLGYENNASYLENLKDFYKEINEDFGGFTYNIALKGEDIIIPANTEMIFVLKENVSVESEY